MTRKSITIIIPVFNEEDVTGPLVEELERVLSGEDVDWDVIFIDDGSTDGTLAQLRALHARDRRYGAISFSRNFGKDTAIAAGFRYATGDAVILMDADLQHPPSTIPAFLEHWRAGTRVVFGQRISRNADGLLRRLYSRLFHAVFRRIAHTRLPAGIVDFLLLDRVAVDALNRLGERTRFSKGLYAWIGFPSEVVPFDSPDRFVGTSRWSFFRLVQFALDGFVSFSSLPLKMWSYIGALISLAAMVYGVFFLLRTLLFNADDVPGFPTLIISIMFFAGVQLVTLGIIGEYLARIYEEVKARPLFVVAEEIGMDGAERQTDTVDDTASE
ncbi:MAG: glycosyltransferase family 2 protein [Alphaproteobacteria bacterium]